MVTAETVRQIALALPDTVERPSYGTLGFFVKKTLFARMLEDGERVVVKMDFDQREMLMQAKPEVYFITDHYLDYPMLIVRLSKVSKSALKELLQGAWEHASE